MRRKYRMKTLTGIGDEICCSVIQSCPTLCSPRDCSMPGFPVLHYLSEFAQIHIHWVGDAIQPSHPLLSVTFSSCLQYFPASGSFPMSQLFTSGGQSIGASASVLPMSIHVWFPLGFIGLTPCTPRGSQELSPIPQFESISSLAFSLLYGPSLISIHDYWKNHSFDYMDLCWQSDRIVDNYFPVFKKSLLWIYT